MNYVSKIVFVGDSGVGKTNIFHQYIYRKPAKTDKTTIGAEFSTKVTNIKGNDIIVQIWDTAGQERFRSINKFYYKDANSIIIMYDVTRRSTFENIKSWFKEIEMNTDNLDNIDISIIGNKTDLANIREVFDNDITELKKSYSFEYYETSIKDIKGIDYVIDSVIERIVNEDRFIKVERFNVSEDTIETSGYCCNLM